jgi:PIN domain nuclease of toxin-antitoxin system
MHILPDTNAFLWFCEDNTNLSLLAKRYIENPDNTNCVSIDTFWEVAIKISLKKMKPKFLLKNLFR